MLSCVCVRVCACVCAVYGADAGGGFLLPFRKPKRIRTAFSPSQLMQLEEAFGKNHYVVGQERKDLAASLSLTETQVCLTLCLITCLSSAAYITID